jgi:hypothetical protein
MGITRSCCTAEKHQSPGASGQTRLSAQSYLDMGQEWSYGEGGATSAAALPLPVQSELNDPRSV